MIYLRSRDGCCGIVNRDVVKLEVDLHCEKEPARFPFPVKPKQKRGAWGGHSRANTPEKFGVLNRSDRRSGSLTFRCLSDFASVVFLSAFPCGPSPEEVVFLGQASQNPVIPHGDYPGCK